MDGLNSNASDRANKKKFKRPHFNAKFKQFSIEIYFMWFSALIYSAETIVDLWLVLYYFIENELQYAVITLSIVIVPAVLCQIYSLWLLRTDNNVSARALMLHILLLGIPYRYHSILQKIATKDKSSSFGGNDGGDGADDVQNIDVIIEHIRDVNAIQTVNAIFQYFPQLLFQSFLIYYVNYRCLLTGVSAGLAGFSFLWHISIHIFYLLKRSNDDYRLNDHNSMPSATHIIDNLSTSLNSTAHSFASIHGQAGSPTGPLNDQSGIVAASLMHPATVLGTGVSATLTENYKNFEKPSYQTDVKNFVASKKHTSKNVEKTKIFGFNKRRPIYEKDEFDMMCETSNLSTVFFEINDSNCLTSSKLETPPDDAAAAGRTPTNLSQSMESLDCSNGRQRYEMRKLCASTDDLKSKELIGSGAGGGGGGGDSLGCSDSLLSISGSRNSLLKRKGICSSQEMLHLVDIMTDNISAEQVDALAKSLIELGNASDSLQTIEPMSIAASIVPDPDALLEQFPEKIDFKLLENIDAAIYENQIIFQERIRKNQLTIQNLKLQDQLLSKCIEEFKLNPTGNDTLSIRDYENMCFANVALQNRGMKHWRNYLQDIDTTAHDNSTVQHSSFYQNTATAISNPDDLYINENDLAAPTSTRAEYRFGAANKSIDESITSADLASTTGDESMLIPCYKKIVQWQTSKVPTMSDASKLSKCSCDEESSTENYYMIMTKKTTPSDAGEKNILVETINKINIVDSPVKPI